MQYMIPNIVLYDTLFIRTYICMYCISSSTIIIMIISTVSTAFPPVKPELVVCLNCTHDRIPQTKHLSVVSGELCLTVLMTGSPRLNTCLLCLGGLCLTVLMTGSPRLNTCLLCLGSSPYPLFVSGQVF